MWQRNDLSSLLHDMGQFMAVALLPFKAMLSVLTWGKMNFPASRESDGPERFCVCSLVNPHITKVGAKRSLHSAAQLPGELLSNRERVAGYIRSPVKLAQTFGLNRVCGDGRSLRVGVRKYA